MRGGVSLDASRTMPTSAVDGAVVTWDWRRVATSYLPV
jgi:hypothetical protein